jgi:uncharacterized membrane-anchored protein
MTTSPRRFLAVSLIIVALVQSAALAKIVYDRVALLQTGREVVLKIKPRDPRDPFKGYYSSLNYDISQLDPRLMAGGHPEFTAGDTAYVLLRSGPEGHAVPVSLYRSMPVQMTGDVVARGTVSAVAPDRINLTYGIEEYYLPQVEAERLDAIPVESIRVVAVAGADGQLAIKRLLVEGEPAYEEPPF